MDLGERSAAGGGAPLRVRVGFDWTADDGACGGERHGTGELELARDAEGWRGAVGHGDGARTWRCPQLPPELATLLTALGLLLLVAVLDGVRVWDGLDGWIGALPRL